ncbi:uncharacterized protein (DUF924 family) [Palleronia aestuarii]|uniref:Uncharacterized protein (DUF924 family) n=1 Tax=Palleronia aestuarii TaxID=568105 RepID=A0A2W7N7H7_9RHOB|nr:DUF924 family protein [Palleronia aestuarii]PZX16018.1 uncharacterized protein (DUF924 family) [Palleronia aestuarii]
MSTPEEVLAFWIDEVGPSGWYDRDDALDATITERFEPVWRRASEGGLSLWLTYPTGTLAYLVVTDQFPRNMFRGDAKAFALDPIALAAAKMAIARNWDTRINEPARQFFYLPLMHSENLSDQDRSVRLFHSRMPETGESNLLHAKAHREVIREFGRFPYRNDALGRKTQKAEQDFMDQGGYGATVKAVRTAA